MKEYLEMLEEFLYYETIPDEHKERIKALIKKLTTTNSDYTKLYTKTEILTVLEEAEHIDDAKSDVRNNFV